MINTYSKFDDVQNVTLQTFNRLMVFNNILEDLGQEAASAYAAQFSIKDSTNIVAMAVYLRQNGLKATRDFATKYSGPELTDEEVQNVTT